MATDGNTYRDPGLVLPFTADRHLVDPPWPKRVITKFHELRQLGRPILKIFQQHSACLFRIRLKRYIARFDPIFGDAEGDTSSYT